MLAATCAYGSMNAPWGGPPAGHGTLNSWFADEGGRRDVEPRSLSMNGTETLAHTHTLTQAHTQARENGPGMRDAVGARAPLPLVACCVSSQPSS